jgi:phosphatidylglycerophosphate synthase
VSSIVNPANGVTAARYLTLPPFWYCIANGMTQWATLIALICGLFDLFDGAVARKFNCSSAFGEMFDAVTDALCYGYMLVLLVAYGYLPTLQLTLILGMGVVNGVFRGIYAKRAGRTVNYRSYAMERTVAYVAYLIGVGINGFLPIFFSNGLVIVMAIVLLHDTKRMLIDPVPAA